MNARRACVTDFLAAEGDFAGHGCDARGGFVGDAFDGFGDFAFGCVVGLFFFDVAKVVSAMCSRIVLVGHTDLQYSLAR